MSKRTSEKGAYVGRGGLKLEFALREFGLDVAGLVAADLGSNIGGFVDCLLQHGAAKVYAVDTSYGTLAWKLRQDPRVVVVERTNALHVKLPEKVDLVTVDIGWTPQRLILPHALSLLKPGRRRAVAGGHVLSLLKPQYEAEPAERHRGVVKPECLDAVVQRTVAQLGESGIRVQRLARSPIAGGGGNVEFFIQTSA
ncbi:MAG: TlyA family rRNA (cytidine-2'-O)-methyltransferase [Planctomycetes bacterium]|nr:TlyA family rRNA (cytidine-2'-O)-methyltransferase [Planctomycetota bacterium]